MIKKALNDGIIMFFNSDKTYLNKDRTKYSFIRTLIADDKIAELRKTICYISRKPKKDYRKIGDREFYIKTIIYELDMDKLVKAKIKDIERFIKKKYVLKIGE